MLRKVKFVISVFLLSILFSSLVFGQDASKDHGSMMEYKNPFWEKIKESSEDYRNPEKPEKMVFKLDPAHFSIPGGVDEFKTVWHFEPVTQGWTGTCWSFSTTSYLESECFRLSGKKIELSEMHTAYWEYIEKAREFVRTRGESAFVQGSEDNAVLRMWDMYGCVPLEAYSGLLEGQPYHDHSVLYKEMSSYLESVASGNAWNEKAVLSTIAAILDTHLGAPPKEFEYQGKTYNPKSFLSEVVQIKTEDYIDFISLKELPYYTKGVYDVPDNWWHSDEYYNIPLDEFMTVLHTAIGKGYSICLGGDTSESGYLPNHDIAVVPSYDIPSKYIDENARQFRFSNKTTTDDHGIHLVGIKKNKSGTWFLIKDSGSGARCGISKGYYYYHEDYLKLKMMNFLVHRSAVEEILKKFN